MADIDVLLKALDHAQWELSEAFAGLPDADVWKRPHPRLLSVGELAAHIAHWEAQSFFGDSFESPLTAGGAHYYKKTVDAPFEKPMTAEQVVAEVKRVHEACKAEFAANPHDAEEPNPHREGWKWGYTIEYQAFHVAYHAGQIYSVRHLLGHETNDN
jgi:hypothetical protein